MHIKPISISLSPNVEKDDIKLAEKAILRPWKWKGGKNIGLLEDKFRSYLKMKYALSFNSGRSSLFAILKALELKEGDEVLLQAFTCNAAANPIIWLGLKPVYIDCNETDFNISLESLRKRVTPKSKVLVVQHTFGFPAKMDEITDFARSKNLVLIEDCAHSLGAEFNGKKIGTFGQVAFFSFSRDKVISSVYGGIAVTNDNVLAEKLRKIREGFGYPSYYWIFQQLLHPILLNYIILPVYNLIDLGKIFLVLSQWFHVLSKAVHWKEKRGERPPYFPKKLPNALALTALNQFNKLEKFYRHRKQIADFYSENLKNSAFGLPEASGSAKPSFLRFPVKHLKAHQIIWEAWNKENILVGDWYTSPIAPFDTHLDKMQYVLGSCPTAEKLSQITLNLPTHINIKEKDLSRILNFLKKYE